MKKLITKNPKRIFTFGCSFTSWIWPTWAHIIAYDLDIPLYNYGKSGAGNQYIFNTLMQADTLFKFNEDDLVMVCWTNVSREDRYVNNTWHNPGNIFSQQTYDMKYVKKWADVRGYTIRDFATIKAAWHFLNSIGCQFHFMKMIDFKFYNQWENNTTESINDLIDFYNFYLSNIEDSFFDVLWGGNIGVRIEKDKLINPIFFNGHPDISEHLLYLEKTFDHNFSKETKNIVNQTNNDLIELIKKETKKSFRNFPSTFFKHSEPFKQF